MDIGQPLRRRIVVPRVPARRPIEQRPAALANEPVRTAPISEREAETV